MGNAGIWSFGETFRVVHEIGMRVEGDYGIKKDLDNIIVCTCLKVNGWLDGCTVMDVYGRRPCNAR